MDPLIWFCCLPAYELSVTRGLIEAFAASLGLPIPAAIYDALWIVPTRSHEARKTAYLWYFALGREWVINPVTEEPEEIVFILNLSFWLELAAYAATPAASCTDGCGRRIYE